MVSTSGGQTQVQSEIRKVWLLLGYGLPAKTDIDKRSQRPAVGAGAILPALIEEKRVLAAALAAPAKAAASSTASRSKDDRFVRPGDSADGFIPEWFEGTIDQSRCMSRIWNSAKGGQCERAPAPGKDLCVQHASMLKSLGKLSHGRVDGKVPPAKYREFLHNRQMKGMPNFKASGGGKTSNAKAPPGKKGGKAIVDVDTDSEDQKAVKAKKDKKDKKDKKEKKPEKTSGSKAKKTKK
mmetsp:Transcript_32060/g.70239  ORF Transcript_32060/g.70239 Transcript_32060/m.70239 type:complete len:238 (-) Transcript_32060:22-735(-)